MAEAAQTKGKGNGEQPSSSTTELTWWFTVYSPCLSVTLIDVGTCLFDSLPCATYYSLLRYVGILNVFRDRSNELLAQLAQDGARSEILRQSFCHFSVPE